MATYLISKFFFSSYQFFNQIFDLIDLITFKTRLFPPGLFFFLLIFVILVHVIYITKMQRQSNGNEQKVVDEKIITNRFLTVNPPEQDSPSGKSTQYV
jgi:hypothetical protein